MRYVGIDIGGTGIKAGLTDENGTILDRLTEPTPASDLDRLLSILSGIFRHFRKGTGIDGVGVGVPGLVSTQTKKVAASPHVPSLKDVDLSSLLAAAVGVPVTVDNDANAGAYGEFSCGAGRGLHHMAY